MPSVDKVLGDPLCEIVVEPGGRRLAMVIRVAPKDDEKLPFFAFVECARIGQGPKSFVQLSCTDREHFQEFYSFLIAVADQVQLHGAHVDEAIADAAQAVRDLLSGGSILKLEQQIGLWGELWVLQQLGGRLGWKVAIDSWIANNGVAEEHDFALADIDIEVKTTNGELRHHHVSSRSQFLAKHGRKLFVASLQITSGGSGGQSLSDIVAAVRSACTKNQLSKLNKSLMAVGWRDVDAIRYPTRWTHRNQPMVINADELPRLRVDGSNQGRMVDWTYVVDVAGLGEPTTGEWSWLK